MAHRSLEAAIDAGPRARWTSNYWLRILVEGLVIGGIVAGSSVFAASRIDDRRSSRELAASERLGWRVTLATADSFQDVDFSGLDLSGFQMRGRDFSRASFLDAELVGAVLAASDLVDADLRGANLDGANLAGASLVRARLSGVEAETAILDGADLSGTDLTEAASLPELAELKVCYDGMTLWPGDPPPLDWRSCWDGYPDNAPRATDQDRLSSDIEYECNYDSVLMTAFAQYPRATEDQSCDFLAYLASKNSPGLRDDRAITGGFICSALSKNDVQEAYTFARIISDEPSLAESKTVLLAAVALLCPEYDEDRRTLLDGFKP